MRNDARWGVVGLVLVLVGAGLVWAAAALAVVALKILAIAVLVLGLVALRVRSWIRRTRVLTQVGRDLHVDEE